MQSKYLGPFYIFDVVGRGGMGAVYEAIHTETHEKAAIKVLLFPFEEDEELRKRFETEIETLRNLRHPNIVRLFGFGEEQQVLYYVMEFVDGQSLQQELRRKRFFTWGEVCKIGLELSQALRHAHDRGIIHRDIKPANILLEYNGDVKLSDFGIAHIYGGHRLTHANSVVGTLEYMSPEQSQGGPIGPKTDLYSLGVVLYTLLVGTTPYQAKTLAEILQKHQSDLPPKISETRPDVPDVFELLIMELLSIKPESRPTNAYLLGQRLEKILKAYLGNPGLIKVRPSEKNIDAATPRPESALGKTSTFNHATSDSDHSFLLAKNGFPQADTPAKKPKSWESRPTADGVFTKSQFRLSDSFEGRLIPEAASPPERTEAHVDLAAHKPMPLPSPGPINPLESLGETEAVSEKHSRFTPVGEEELGGFSKYEDRNRPNAISIQTISLSICLLGIGFFIYYLLQPVSANTLYNRIVQAVGAENADENSPTNLARLLKAESKIDLFLALYPSDPRREQMSRYIEEIKLEKLQREFDLRINRFQNVDNLQPLERICLEAFTLARTQPEKAIVKFQAILDVYGSGLETPEETQEKETKDHGLEGRPRSESRNDLCLELVRRRLSAIQNHSSIQDEGQKEFLKDRLDKAVEMDQVLPEQSDKIRCGIIEIYQDKPWATPFVERAKEEMNKKEL